MKRFNVLVRNIETNNTYSLMFSAKDREHAVLQMGMELGDVMASNDPTWIVEDVIELTT